jgi:hypothetical protein
MKFFKMKSLAGALTLATLSSSAFALAPGAAVDTEIFLSGASAQQVTLERLLTNDFCASSIDFFYDDAGTNNGTDISGKNYRAYSCTFKNAAPIPNNLRNKNVRIHYRFKGGSIYGVNPVARAESVQRMNPSAANCTLVSTGKYSCKIGTLVTDVPDIGASDVEPDLFTTVNLPPSAAGDPETPWTVLSKAELGNLTKKSAYGVVFGIGVSNDIRLNGGINDLSKTQLISILSGAYRNWSQVGGPNAPIHVCRRVAGSGTQAGANAYFTNDPCSEDKLTFVKQSDSGTPTGYVVEEFDSSSKILTDCLNVNDGAIGLSSIEKQPGGSNGTNWGYISINGIPATTANAATGKYDYWFENSIQYRNKTVHGVPAPSGNTLLLLQLIASEAPKAGVIAGAALPGVNAIPDFISNSPNNPYSSANPVAWGSRAGKACKPIQNFFPF